MKTKKMKKKWKDLWVCALRGGKFIQGRGSLRDSKNHCCCLGVICDLVDPEGWRVRKGYYEGYDDWSHDAGPFYPPPTVLVTIGLSHSDSRMLARKNDGGTPFIEIANYIEKYL